MAIAVKKKPKLTGTVGVVRKVERQDRRSLEQEKDFVKILYYGDPGSGKTTHLATAANIGKTIFIDAESGLKRGALRRRGITLENIEPFRTITFDAMEKLFWELKGRLEDGEKIEALIWDSVTETQRTIMEGVIEEAIKRAAKKGIERDRWHKEISDWGVNIDQMRDLIRKFRDLPIHVGMACLPDRTQDDDGSVTYAPDVTPRLQRDLMGYVDIMCYTRTVVVDDGEPEFQGLFRRQGTKLAKDRFGILPKVLVDPTLERVVAYINEELNVENDPVTAASAERHMKAGKIEVRKQRVAK